jgi:hypothetical protein
MDEQLTRRLCTAIDDLAVEVEGVACQVQVAAERFVRLVLAGIGQQIGLGQVPKLCKRALRTPGGKCPDFPFEPEHMLAEPLAGAAPRRDVLQDFIDDTR